MRRLAAAIGMALGAFVFACGGTVASVDSPSGGPDGGTPTSDGSPGTPPSDAFAPTDGSPIGAGCPAAAPVDGAPCAVAGLSCEYGGYGDHLLCSTIAICQPAPARGAPIWIVNSPAKDCISSPAANPPACPATYGAIPTGGACPQGAPSQCVYAEGVCGCSPCAPDGSNVFTNEWACAPWPAPSGCPAVRPRVGTPCAPEGQTCMYANVCGVNDGEPAIGCVAGVWAITPFGADCAVAQCGP